MQTDVQTIFHYFYQRIIFPLPSFFWKYSPQGRTETEALSSYARIKERCINVITNERQKLATLASEAEGQVENATSRTGSDNTSNSKSSRSGTLLNVMLRQTSTGEPALTDDELVANSFIFFLAGSDTTAVTLSWTCYYMSEHPSMMQELRDEVNSLVLQNNSDDSKGLKDPSTFSLGEFFATHTDQLPKCTAFFKETLRLRSIISFFDIGVASKDTPTVLSNGITLNPGDDLFLFLDALLYDPVVFPDPLSFQPSRWLTSDPVQQAAMASTSLVFGYGPRECPGKGLAMAEGVTALAALVYHFDMSLACPASEIERIMSFVAKANKMPIRLTPVNHT
jgi:cytochrome P450